MAGPPRLPKPPFSATLVIQASRELTWSEKGVWLRIWALDRDARGCYASAIVLGEDVGLGARAVEKLRASLVAAGILGSDGRRGRDGSAWFALLPGGAIPRRERPSREERQACVAYLDGHIRMCRADSGIPNDRSGFKKGETPNNSSGFDEAVNPNAGSAFHGDETPNSGSGLVATRNPNDEAGTPNDRSGLTADNPNAGSGFNVEIPNSGSPEVIKALPTEISVSYPVLNTPTSARAHAREEGAVARDSRHSNRTRTTGPEPIAAVLDRVELR